MPKRNVTQAALIGRRILKRRKELGLTQENLADRSGLSQSFLTCVERGEKGPRLKPVPIICLLAL